MNSITFRKSKSDATTGITATGIITIESPGWSGHVVRRDTADAADREFMLNIGSSYQSRISPENGTCNASGGFVTYDANGGIIGISLEHFGAYPDDSTDTNGGVQALGFDSGGDNSIPAWGAAEADTAPSIYFSSILVHNFHYENSRDGGQSGDLTDVGIQEVGAIYPYAALKIPVSTYGNWAAGTTSSLITDLPIFATDAHLMEYINSGGTIIEHMLNKNNPEDEYELNEKCWYIHNVFGHNTKNRNDYTGARNYKFFPQTGRICLYRQEPTASDPYSLRLLGVSNYEVYSAGAYDENYEPYSGSVESTYMSKSLRFSSSDYWTVFVGAESNTNIPIFGSLSQATDYIASRIEITEAENYANLAIAENEIIEPDFGVEDAATDIGKNEQVYNIAGFHLYAVTHTELSSFFLEIFNTDPNVVDQIMEGCKLFSGNEINAIMMCMFLPIDDISKICTMSSTSKITVGTWTADHSEGTRISKNDVIMNMGSTFIPYRYNSEEDFEPYTQLWVQLPYCGTHPIQVSKYIGKTMRCDYAVSVADGSCKAMLFADDILMDEFPGNMGCMRPISAADAAQYVSNIVNGVMDLVPTLNQGAGVIADAMGGGGATVAAVGSAAGVATNGVWKGYQLLQAAETPPMTQIGALSGGISYFGVQKPHIIIAQKKTVRPANERLTIGYPSGRGGKVSSFSGYLKASAVKMPNFSGTAQELNDIMTALSHGIYL